MLLTKKFKGMDVSIKDSVTNKTQQIATARPNTNIQSDNSSICIIFALCISVICSYSIYCKNVHTYIHIITNCQ